MRRGVVIAILSFGGLLGLGCEVHVSPEERLVLRYSEGIQSYHDETYEDFFLACNPSEKMKTLRERLQEHEEQRRGGTATFSPDGIEIIKLATLGRGAFFKVLESKQVDDTLRFTTVVQPGYSSLSYIEATSFPEGTIIYVLGEPFGTVPAVKVGEEKGPLRRVVWSVDLEWVWKQRTSNELGWCLLSLQPVADSVTYQDVQFNEALPSPEPAPAMEPEAPPK